MNQAQASAFLEAWSNQLARQDRSLRRHVIGWAIVVLACVVVTIVAGVAK